jgi:hypothetical protein
MTEEMVALFMRKMLEVGATGGAANAATNLARCLTTVSPLNLGQLAVASCSGKASQNWTGPQQS